MAEVLDALEWQMALASRTIPNAPAPTPGMKFKLLGNNAVSYDSRDVSVDVKKMTATGIISTPKVDLSNDIVIGEGIDTSVHSKNRLVLLMHQPTHPVGRDEDESGNYTVRIGEDRTTATTHFFQKSLEAEQAFRLVEMKALPGMSIGMRPKPGAVEMKNYAGQQFCVIKECLMIENSHVYFPDNPECAILAVQKGLGGRPMVDSLKQLLLPLLPAPMVWSNGATFKRKRRLWMPEIFQGAN
jgi:hypothetical protein